MTLNARTWARRLPWSVAATAVALLLLGLLAIARCSQWDSADIPLLRRQAAWAALGLAAMLAVSLPTYRLLCRWSYSLYVASLIALTIVFLFPTINGTHRWIRIGPLSFQPSEFAKVAFALALARYLMHRENYRRIGGLLLPLALTLAPVLLILREPHLGMAMLFFPVLFLMLYAAGARRRDLAILLLLGAGLSPLVWSQMSENQRDRVSAMLKNSAAGQRQGDEGYQLHQAKRMLALGGPWGSLLAGQPTEDRAAYRLGEADNDFIFCVVKERLGLPGAALTLALYAILAWRGLAIAAATREPFGRMAAVGLTAMIFVQAVVNVGMNLGLLPITGLPLPMVSYGGSSLLAHCVAIGLLLNIGMRPGYEVTNEPFRWTG